MVSRTNNIDDHVLHSFANNMIDVFNSPAVSDMLRLKGWDGAQESCKRWPSDPEKFGVDITSKQGMSEIQRGNYDFWSTIAEHGFQVCSGRIITQGM